MMAGLHSRRAVAAFCFAACFSLAVPAGCLVFFVPGKASAFEVDRSEREHPKLAHAKTPMDEYTNGIVDLAVRKLGGDKVYIMIDIVNGASSCTGSFDGVGKIKGKVITISQKEEGGGNPLFSTCFIKITIKGDKAVVEDRCLLYHGATCTFEGVLTKKKQHGK